MNKYLVPGIVVVLVIAAGAFFMMNKNKGNEAMPTEQTQETQTEATNEMKKADTSSSSAVAGSSSAGSASAVVGDAIEVTGSNFKFEPNVIKVKKGQKVKINFVNKLGFHDFVVDELKVRTSQINAGKNEFVEFTPEKSGSFEFYCSVGKHREMGMKGTLIVE